MIRDHAGRVEPASFEPVKVQVRESHVSAWIHLAGHETSQSQHGSPPSLDLPPPPGTTAEPSGTLAALVPPGWPELPPVTALLGKLPAEVRGREGLLGELRRALRPYPWRASRAFVIAGVGGLGKSTVALAAARMARDRGCRVWWVSAADAATLTGGMLEVLRDLGAPESVTVPVREGERTAPERAWEFLNGRHAAGRRWLLVLDGADDPEALASADAMTPADGRGWLRADPAGMVIVTTRNRNPEVWGTAVTLRELRPLDDESGVRVLRDLAPAVADPGGREALDLSRRLGGLPLALHLAGAYLGSPFARWSSFAEYHQALDSVQLPHGPRPCRGHRRQHPRRRAAHLGSVPCRARGRRAAAGQAAAVAAVVLRPGHSGLGGAAPAGTARGPARPSGRPTGRGPWPGRGRRPREPGIRTTSGASCAMVCWAWRTPV